MAQLTVDISITVSPASAPFAVDASGVPRNAQVGQGYTGKLVASGGQPPYKFTLTQGALPDGLSLNPDTGDISGTPTTEGAFDATIVASDALGASVVAQVRHQS